MSEWGTFLSHFDVVYLPYYLLVRLPVAVLGTSPLVIQTPSFLATGVTAALVFLAAHRAAGPRAAWMSVLALALLPRTFLMGMEARPYALAAAFVALSLYALIRHLTQPRLRHLITFALAAALAAHIQLLAALTIVGMVLAALLLARTWTTRGSILAAAAVAGASSIPLAALASRQASQVDWIGLVRPNLPEQVLVEAFFPYRTSVRFLAEWQEPHRLAAIALAALSAVIILAGLAAGRRSAAPVRGVRVGAPDLGILAGITLAVPVTILVTLMMVQSSAFVPRYLANATPVLALVMGVLAARIPTGVARPLLSVAAVAAVFLYVGHRDPRGKFEADDYAWIASQVREVSSDGDAVLFDPGPWDPIDSGRNATVLYPRVFDGLLDVAAGEPLPLVRPWPTDPPRVDLSTAPANRVVLVTSPSVTDSYAATLPDLGYVRGDVRQGPTHTVELWTLDATE